MSTIHNAEVLESKGLDAWLWFRFKVFLMNWPAVSSPIELSASIYLLIDGIQVKVAIITFVGVASFVSETNHPRSRALIRQSDMADLSTLQN